MNVIWVHIIVMQMHSVLMWIMATSAIAENLSILEMEQFVQVCIQALNNSALLQYCTF